MQNIIIQPYSLPHGDLWHSQLQRRAQQSQHRIAAIAASYRSNCSIVSQHRIAASYRSIVSQHRIAAIAAWHCRNRSIVSHRSNHRQHRIAAIAAWHCSIVSQHRIAASYRIAAITGSIESQQSQRGIAASYRSIVSQQSQPHFAASWCVRSAGSEEDVVGKRLQGMDGIGLRTTAPPEFEGHYSVSYGYNPLPIYHSQRFPAGRRQQSIISNTLKSQARSDPSRVAGDSVLQQGHSLNP